MLCGNYELHSCWECVSFRLSCASGHIGVDKFGAYYFPFKEIYNNTYFFRHMCCVPWLHSQIAGISFSRKKPGKGRYRKWMHTFKHKLREQVVFFKLKCVLHITSINVFHLNKVNELPSETCIAETSLFFQVYVI